MSETKYAMHSSAVAANGGSFLLTSIQVSSIKPNKFTPGHRGVLGVKWRHLPLIDHDIMLTFRLDAHPVEVSRKLLCHVSLAASGKTNHHNHTWCYGYVRHIRTLYYKYTNKHTNIQTYSNTVTTASAFVFNCSTLPDITPGCMPRDSKDFFSGQENFKISRAINHANMLKKWHAIEVI